MKIYVKVNRPEWIQKTFRKPIDSMVCSKPLLHDEQEIIIEEEENLKPTGKNRTDDKTTISKLTKGL